MIGDRLPKKLGTVLLLAGIAIMPLCYYAVGMAMRHEASCDALASGSGACASEARFWREVAIAGFVAALLVSFVGVVLDRLRAWR